MKKNIIALIVAAGESRRAGGDVPKQYQLLDGKSLLRRTIEEFLHHDDITTIKVVINPLHHDYYEKNTQDISILPPVEGGATRQKSVEIGLESLVGLNPDYVLIHDAARPNISSDVISRVIAALEQNKAVIPALPVYDTLKHVEEETIVGTIERKKLFRAQTPQGFHFNDILEAHKKACETECTDDAAVAEYSGLEIKIVTGSEHNYKITTQEDLQDAALLLAASFETRVGSGFDVHKITTESDKKHVTICGINIEAGFSLVGHSDADVGLHALVDAILGAIAEGDIGTHFSPSDVRWKNADSALFVKHAVNLLKEKRSKLINVDITIICERPHIASQREQMITKLANLLEIDRNRISVKATTTEKLGFTGRGEGIAAQAIVSVKLPTEKI
ncbi:MAG: bifunctional 2-C-methyl-D-erythritol 4-phosphate cytidylyltransferase/2-C-methyl-D-erythritol 2,4-cyclodiphosphate synthase [Pseudomonadota bacterium]